VARLGGSTWAWGSRWRALAAQMHCGTCRYADRGATTPVGRSRSGPPRTPGSSVLGCHRRGGRSLTANGRRPNDGPAASLDRLGAQLSLTGDSKVSKDGELGRPGPLGAPRLSLLEEGAGRRRPSDLGDVLGIHHDPLDHDPAELLTPCRRRHRDRRPQVYDSRPVGVEGNDAAPTNRSTRRPWTYDRVQAHRS